MLHIHVFFLSKWSPAVDQEVLCVVTLSQIWEFDPQSQMKPQIVP